MQPGDSRWRSCHGEVRLAGAWCGRDSLSLKVALWAVVIALAVYGIVLYARGDFG